MNKFAEAALGYARDGWAVFPVKARDKVPAVATGFKAATIEQAEIATWWKNMPGCNIGIATGTASSGLFVIDFDVDEEAGKNGLETLYKWEQEHEPFPETACVLSGGGGEHLYFYSNQNIGNSVNGVLGVDVRGDGGYILAPPSIHPSGHLYEWKYRPKERPIAQANSNVYAFIRYIQGERQQQKQFELPEKISSGNRNNVLYKFACSLQAKGFSDNQILERMIGVNTIRCNPPLPNNELKKIIQSALKHDKGANNSAALMLNSNNRPYQNSYNVMRVLQTDKYLVGRIGYDEITYTKTIKCPVPWDKTNRVRPIKDSDYCSFAIYLEKNYFLNSKSKAIDAIISVAEQNHYNSLVQWLDSLVWDGEKRIDRLLTMFLGALPDEYNAEVMRLFMLGAVARAYEPGVKFDYMPVLVGRQGIGKSMFLRKLARKSELFCDNFNTIEGDAAIEKLRGIWIAELAELLATKRAKEVESIKAFVTSTVDTIRPKYARETEHRPRVCVFAGTTNNSNFLVDATGNRRFLPIECHGSAPLSLFDEGTEEYFEQAWAEAVHIYKNEHPALVLSSESEKQATTKQDRYLEDDPRIGKIQQYLDGLEQNVNICVAELCECALGMDKKDYYNKRSVSNDIHNIMHKMEEWEYCGRQYTQVYGRQRCYKRRI